MAFLSESVTNIQLCTLKTDVIMYLDALSMFECIRANTVTIELTSSVTTCVLSDQEMRNRLAPRWWSPCCFCRNPEEHNTSTLSADGSEGH